MEQIRIEDVKNKLNEWYDDSSLIGLYIVGSYSLNEYNDFSDIDFVGISTQPIHIDNISQLRHQLKECLEDTVLSSKISFRIRSIEEISDFEIQCKSWGYDLHTAFHLFGQHPTHIFKRFSDINCVPSLAFDNLLEKHWYDILYVNSEINYIKKRYLCAKSILYYLNALLYHNNITLGRNVARVDHIKKNEELITALPIITEQLDACLLLKHNPYIEIKHIDFSALKDQVLFAIYTLLMPNFYSISQTFGSYKYWGYSEIMPDLMDLGTYPRFSDKKSSNPQFNWRINLLNTFLKIGNDGIQKENNNQYNISYLEKIRRDTSLYGFDSYKSILTFK